VKRIRMKFDIHALVSSSAAIGHISFEMQLRRRGLFFVCIGIIFNVHQEKRFFSKADPRSNVTWGL
jgi:hypothetical protein